MTDEVVQMIYELNNYVENNIPLLTNTYKILYIIAIYIYSLLYLQQQMLEFVKN